MSNTYGDAHLQGGSLHQGNIYHTTSQDTLKPSFFKTFDYEGAKDFNPKRVKGTCNWVLTHPNFESWRDNPSAKILWITADPGCGKSTLSRALVDEQLVRSDCENNAPCSTPILYFLFKDTGDQALATTAVCALLHQLYCIPGVWSCLEQDAREIVDREGTSLPGNLTAMWRLLIRSLSGVTESSPIICVLDALDECKELDRRELMKHLETYITGSYPADIKFLITSRPYHNIKYDFRDMIDEMPTIHLDGGLESESIGKEIDLVIDNKLSVLRRKMRLSPEVVQKLTTKLKSMENRTYLWLMFIWEDISQMVGPTDREIIKQIEQLPETVEAAYEKILMKSPQPEIARAILSLVVVSSSPLTLRMLELLAKVTPEMENIVDVDLAGEERFKDVIRNACGLFVAVNDRKVYLMHQTAKDFLLSHYDDEAERHDGNERTLTQTSRVSEKLVWRGVVDVLSASCDLGCRIMQMLSLKYSETVNTLPLTDRDAFHVYQLLMLILTVLTRVRHGSRLDEDDILMRLLQVLRTFLEVVKEPNGTLYDIYKRELSPTDSATFDRALMGGERILSQHVEKTTS